MGYLSLWINIRPVLGGVKQYYENRIKRVVIPYLVMALLWYGIEYLFLQVKPVEILYEISTLSFWIEHKGAWYVAMLLPVYLVYPFYYCWNKQKIANTIIVCIIMLFITIVLSIVKPNLYTHLSQVLYSLIAIAIGTQCANMVKKGHNMMWVALIAVFPYIMRIILKIDWPFLGTLSYALLGISAAIVFSEIIEKIPQVLNNYLKKLGLNSFEMYLANIFLIQAFHIFLVNDDGSLSLALSMVIYFCIIALSVVWSLVTKYFTRHINAVLFAH